jgi:hypothetical protein
MVWGMQGKGLKKKKRRNGCSWSHVDASIPVASSREIWSPTSLGFEPATFQEGVVFFF